MLVRYLEIVTPDVEGTCSIFEKSMGAVFKGPNLMLGNARVADMTDGGQVGVRAPLHDSEEPVTRSYFLTRDIEKATADAIASGAELAHPVMEIPGIGTFSIFFHGNNQFGFWQD